MRIKRPLCAAAVIWAAAIWLLGNAGIPFFSWDSPGLLGDVKDEKVLVTGILYQKDIYETVTNLYLKKANLIILEKEYPIDNIKITIENEILSEPAQQGDLTAVRGELEEIPEAANPGQFDERIYYYARKVKWYMDGEEFQILQKETDPVLALQGRIKERISLGLQKAFGSEKSGIMEAMILGEKGNLGQENKLLFQIMGISHILAISGTHLSILGWGLYKVLIKCRLPIKASGILAAAVMVFYGGLTGNQAAAVRAVIMFGVSAGALLGKRTYDFLSALSLAAILILAESPLYLYDSSFLLSFGAVLGLAAVHPVLFPPKRKRRSRKLTGRFVTGLEQGVCSSISVWSILLPVTMYFFCELSVWGFLVNLLILPTVGILLISGLAGGILGLFPAALPGQIGALPGLVLLECYIRGGKFLQELPVFLWITGRPELWQCGIYYGILTLLLLAKNKRKSQETGKKTPFWGKGYMKKWFPAGAMAVFGLSLFLLFFRPLEGSLKVTFLDVGQGDCACIQQESGSCYLIDGGSSSVSKAGQYRILPFLKEQGIRRIEGIFVSHMDEDHVNGIMELLEMSRDRKTGLKIARLFLSECKETQEQREKLEKAGEEAGCQIFYIKKGSTVKKGKLNITCLSPERDNMESNEGSQALLAEAEGCSFLFTGDIEGMGEEQLLSVCREAGITCDILKVAHHGSRNSTSEELLDVIRPEAAVISCGEDNLYGHPHQELLRRLEDRKIRTFQTDNTGAVFAVVKKEKIQVSFQLGKSMLE